MSRGRTPNSGPYIVSYRYTPGHLSKHECHTWADACHFMRHCLVSGYTEVSVAFA